MSHPWPFFLMLCCAVAVVIDNVRGTALVILALVVLVVAGACLHSEIRGGHHGR